MINKRFSRPVILALFIVGFTACEETDSRESGDFNLGPEAVSATAMKTDNGISVQYRVEKGYGIQKKGPHQITVFALKQGHQLTASISEKINKYGTEVALKKEISFSGETAEQDKEYFSTVEPYKIEVKEAGADAYAVKGRIFFCSFSDKFCSAQTVNAVAR